MTNEPRMNAITLVDLLTKVTDIDAATVARSAGVPLQNLRAWLGGKAKALRLKSIVSILATLGIKVDGGKSALDCSRVHFWHVDVGTFARKRSTFGAITRLSELLARGAITEVRPERKRWSLWQRLTRRVYLVSANGLEGGPFNVVLSLRKSPFRNATISPALIKGTFWRAEAGESRCITVRADLWSSLITGDTTPAEFERAFEGVANRFTWSDVDLMAREFGYSPDDVAEWMLKQDETIAKQSDSRAYMYLINGREHDLAVA